MRPRLLLPILAISLTANVWFWLGHQRHSRVLPRLNEATATNTDSTLGLPAPTPSQTNSPAAGLKELVADLRTSNLPARLIRVWTKAAIDAQFSAREQALAAPVRQHFWDADPYVPLATQLAKIDLQVEKSRLLDDLVGYDPTLPENAGYSFLPLEKQRPVKDVFEIYSARIRALTEVTSVSPYRSMATDSEQAEIARMKEEMDDKLAAWLTPAERLQVEARTTIAQAPASRFDANGADITLRENGWYRIAPAAARLRESLRYFDATAEEFTTIYEITKAMEARHAFERGDSNMQRGEITAAAQAALGAERGTAYAQLTDRNFLEVADYVVRSGLPASAGRDALSLQSRLGAESTRIGRDSTLTHDQKLKALNTLADNGWNEFEALLGPTVAAGARGLINGTLQTFRRGMYQVPADETPPGTIGYRAIASPVGPPTPR